MKQELKSGFEQDCFTGWRHVLCYVRRAGVRKKAKKQVNRRARREAKKDIKENYDD